MKVFKCHAVLFLLCMSMINILSPQIVMAKPEKHVSGSCYWTIDDDGTLTIWPKNGKYGLLASQSTWNEYENIIKKVVIKPGVRAKNCGNMFRDLIHCREMDLSGLDTSEVTNMSCMFHNCSELKYLDLSHFDTSHVESMDYMFYRCIKLSAIDLSGFDTSHVMYMRSMFDCCFSLDDLDVSTFNTENVRNMTSMFLWCTNLSSIDVSNFNTSKVEYMQYMFSGCKKMKSLDLSGFDTSKVIMMYGMMSYCDELKKVDISGFNTEKVVSMDKLFTGCYELSKIRFGKDFQFKGKFKASYLPKPSSEYPYTGKWIRADGKYGPFKNKQLIKNYTGDMHGKWIWENVKNSYKHTDPLKKETKKANKQKKK